MKFKLLLFSMLISLIAISCAKKELEGYTTYEDETHGFTIQYPEDWTARGGLGKDNESITGAIVVFQSPSEGKTDVFRENSYIFSESVPDSVTDLESYIRFNKTNLPNQLQEFEIKEEGTQVIDGKKSHWMIFSYVQRLQKVMSIAYVFYKDDQGFAIVSTSRPDVFMKYRRTFENISTSINFN